VPDDFSDRKLVLKKNFNLPKLVPPTPGPEYSEPQHGPPHVPPLVSNLPLYLLEPDEPSDYYRPPIMFPLPNGGNDHADSNDHIERTARNDQRRPPRP
jgi:hypothetical protein